MDLSNQTVCQLLPLHNSEVSLFCTSAGYGMGGGAEWTVDEMLSPLDETAWAETLPSE